MARRRTDWSGVFAVTVTPFDEDGALDEAGFCSHLDCLVRDGVRGIVVAGSTGEWYSLHDAERVRLFELARDRVGGQVVLIGGTSAIATRDAVSLTRAAQDLGLDGAMVLAPPYALPNRREVLGHFEALAEVGLPLMVYNNPARTQVTLDAALLEDLCAFDSVVALKDSSKDLYAVSAALRQAGDRLAVFSGLEPYALPAIARGAVGVVSMAVNILGRSAVDLHAHAAAGRWADAQRIEARLDRLYEAFYLGGFGAYVVIKACMNLVGRSGGWPRRPHLPVDAQARARLAALLEEIGAEPGPGSGVGDARTGTD